MTTEGENKTYEAILRRVVDLPSLPDVVNSILDLLMRPNTPASEISKLIAYDPGLTSKFLRMVNSAAYGFQRQISSVQHAVMILGFSTVRGVVLSASIFKMFENQRQFSIDPNSFWQHSIQTAIASRILANKWNIPYAEDAFTAGLLHDIGKMILDCHFSKEYSKVIELARLGKIAGHGRKYLDLESHVLSGITHAEIGYALAARWKLPATLQEVIRYHHDPEKAETARELVFVVALANAFSQLTLLNYKVFNPDYFMQSVRDYFQYDPENPEPFEALYKSIQDEMDGVDELLSTLKR